MSNPATTERVRLEFDDGTGIDFATREDALFHICYGKPAVGLRGVLHVCAVTDTDADEIVVDGKPQLTHTEPVHGDVIWTREQLQVLVDAANAAESTPVLHADPDKTTIDALTEVVAGVEA